MTDDDDAIPQVEAAFRAIKENWTIARNVYGTLTVYLLYRNCFYPIGSPQSVAGLSLSALSEAVDLARRHPEMGYPSLPAANLSLSEAEYGKLVERNASSHAARQTVPLACLRLPLTIIHQMLQLPADYAIKQVAVEEDALQVYCLTPECATMDTTGNPVIHADYRLEERDGVSWRSLLTVRVEPVHICP